MRITQGFEGREELLVEVFRSAFAASEGDQEGDVIADLVRTLFSTTAAEDIRVFSAEDDGVIGAVAFTRLRFPEDDQNVLMLSPMAVTPARWRTGIGGALITAALRALGEDGIDICITYGDPAYYGRVGFHQISEAEVQPPLPLSMPMGWLGRRLDGSGKPALRGPSICVAAFQKAAYW